MVEKANATGNSPVGTSARTVRVTVVQCVAARQVVERLVVLPEGASAQDALRAAGIEDAEKPAPLIGIWGKACLLTQPLQDGDRLEIYRPLLVDPKVARRERFAQQGSRGAGLFAHTRTR